MASRSAQEQLNEADEASVAQWRIRKLIQSLSKARGYVRHCFPGIWCLGRGENLPRRAPTQIYQFMSPGGLDGVLADQSGV